MSNQVFTGVPLGWAFKIKGSVQAYKGVGAVLEIEMHSGDHPPQKLQFIAVVRDERELTQLRETLDNKDTKFWPLAVCHGDQVEWNEDKVLAVPPLAAQPDTTPLEAGDEEDW